MSVVTRAAARHAPLVPLRRDRRLVHRGAVGPTPTAATTAARLGRPARRAPVRPPHRRGRAAAGVRQPRDPRAAAAADHRRAGPRRAGAGARPGGAGRRRQRHPAARAPTSTGWPRNLEAAVVAAARGGRRRAARDRGRPARQPVVRRTRSRVGDLQLPHLVDRAPPRRVRARPVGHALAARLADVGGGPHPPHAPRGTAGSRRPRSSALGLEPDDAAWDDPLDAAAAAPRGAAAREDAAWVREHVYPWATRRLRGTSSGDDRAPKRPGLGPLD